ncbi:hypothetical protein BLX87_04220 [Bacillus sp. VT-16-64]|nr:hypothetical protein BLX87_04220 [Bacillus sp. VT-16-64]
MLILVLARSANTNDDPHLFLSVNFPIKTLPLFSVISVISEYVNIIVILFVPEICGIKRLQFRINEEKNS